MKLKSGLGTFMSSRSETDWAYTTAPKTTQGNCHLKIIRFSDLHMQAEKRDGCLHHTSNLPQNWTKVA